jgi:chromosome segregation ATPase
MYNSAQEAEKVHTEEVAQLNATILRNDTQVTSLNDIIAVMESKIAALEDEVATTKSEREEVVNKRESTTQQLSLARDEVSTHSAIVSKLESSINALQNERDNAVKQLGDVLSSSHCDEEVMSKLCCEKDELASAIKALTVKFNIEEANHKQCMEELERVKGECTAIASDLANSKEANITLELRIQQKTEDEHAVDNAIASSNAQIDQLTTQVSTLTEERNDLVSRLTEVTALGDDLKNKLALSEAEVSKHSANVSNLETQVEALITDRDTAIEKMNAVLSSKGVLDEVLLSLNKEKDELASALKQSMADVARLEAEKDEVTASLNFLQEMIVDMESQKAQIATLTQERDELEAKWKEVVVDLESSLESKLQEIDALKGQLDATKNQFVVADNHVAAPDAIDTLKNEVNDLKSLLASANSSVDEARSAARMADKELQETILQLENALGNLVVQEEARRAAEVKIRSMELSLHNSTRADSEEELLRDMERKCTLVMYYIIFVGVNTQSTHYSFLHPQFSWARRSTRNLGWSKS